MIIFLLLWLLFVFISLCLLFTVLYILLILRLNVLCVHILFLCLLFSQTRNVLPFNSFCSVLTVPYLSYLHIIFISSPLFTHSNSFSSTHRCQKSDVWRIWKDENINKFGVTCKLEFCTGSEDAFLLAIFFSEYRYYLALRYVDIEWFYHSMSCKSMDLWYRCIL